MCNGDSAANWKTNIAVGFEAQAIALKPARAERGRTAKASALIRLPVTFRAVLVAMMIVCPGFSIEIALTAQMPAEQKHKNRRQTSRRLGKGSKQYLH